MLVLVVVGAIAAMELLSNRMENVMEGAYEVVGIEDGVAGSTAKPEPEASAANLIGLRLAARLTQ